MAKGISDKQHYIDIADAIRSRSGGEAVYKPSEMAAAIQAIEGGRKISGLTINENLSTFCISYEDGGVITGNATFDENGLPTGLTDDNGNTVNFASGYPYSATNKEGVSIPILWGGNS